MAKLLTLSESDRRVLQDFLNRARSLLGNTSGRPAVLEEEYQTPDVCIARPPAEGIAGMMAAEGGDTGTGTSTSTSDVRWDSGMPPSAECDLYRIIQGGLELAGPAQTVYNLGEGISADAWLVVAREKWGSWIVVSVFYPADPGTGTTACVDPDVWETEVRCEGDELVLYRRPVTLSIVGNCLTRTSGPFERVRVVACNVDCCETGTGTEVGTGTGADCVNCAGGTPAAYYHVGLEDCEQSTMDGCVFNMCFDLEQEPDDPCTWSYEQFDGTVVLTKTATEYILTITNSTGTIVYSSIIPQSDDCCQPITLQQDVDAWTSYCDPADFPNMLTLFPSCAPDDAGTGTVTGTPQNACCDWGGRIKAHFTNVSGCACLDGVEVILQGTGPVWVAQNFVPGAGGLGSCGSTDWFLQFHCTDGALILRCDNRIANSPANPHFQGGLAYPLTVSCEVLTPTVIYNMDIVWQYPPSNPEPTDISNFCCIGAVIVTLSRFPS